MESSGKGERERKAQRDTVGTVLQSLPVEVGHV